MEISGRLQSIVLNVIAQDYKVIMQILERNMTEGQNEFKKPRKPRSSQPHQATKGAFPCFHSPSHFSLSSTPPPLLLLVISIVTKTIFFV